MQDLSIYHSIIPCLHRIHDTVPVAGAHRIQHRIGMSISLADLQMKLTALNTATDKKILVTFDDGYQDNLLAVPLLQKFPNIQPVLFLTGKQMRGDIAPLPLAALYHWCDANNVNPDNMKAQYGFDRALLKTIPEDEQQKLLANIDIDCDAVRHEMLTSADIDTLIKHGWLIGYHGYEHYDLTLCNPQLLQAKLTQDMALLQKEGHVSWFAYPEGRHNNMIATMARKAGFTLQFGLQNPIDADDVWAREIWR